MSSRPRKVLYVATTITAGGIARASTRFASELLKRGNQVIYATAPTGAIREHCISDGVPVETLLPKNSGDLGAVGTVARLVRKYQPDIVHIHSRRDYVPVAVGVRIGGIGLASPPKVVLHLHLRHVMGKPPRLAGLFFQNWTTRAIAVSKTVRDYVVDAHHLRPEYVETVYNGIDCDAYLAPGTTAYDAARASARARWGIPVGAPVIGMVGRHDAKGQLAVIERFRDVLNVVPEAWLALMGKETADKGGRDYREAAHAAGVAERVVVMGLVDDVPAALPMLDLLLHLPSDEAFGLALVEAMAAGLPVVASDIDGCREVLDMTGGGIAVPLGDIPAAINAVAAFLDPAAGAALRADYTRRGGSAVREKLAMAAQVDALEALYDRL
ncbi:MAG: glycosyltransferase [Capsulimonadaceae bacterium]|nr:glycosyltransferase [Capsulimonadaceae bacterium]